MLAARNDPRSGVQDELETVKLQPTDTLEDAVIVINSEMGTRLFGFESDSSPDLVGLDVLEFHTIGLWLDLTLTRLEACMTRTRLDRTPTSGLGPDSTNCEAENSIHVHLTT